MAGWVIFAISDPMFSRRHIDRYLPIGLHILAWTVFAVIVYSINPVIHKPGGFAYYYGTKFFPQLIIFYLNYAFLIPRVLSQLKVLGFLLLNLTAMALLSVACELLFGGQWPSGRSFMMIVALLMLNQTLFLLLALVIRFAVDWFRQKLKTKQAENEALKSELYFLKAQVNPHFLFNSLNNLYALVLKSDQSAPEVILGISRIMRYLLYETNETLVSLTKEIDILKAYDDLHQLRDRNKQDIIRIEGAPGQLQITPLLLLPLAENLYKHGVAPFVIHIHINGKQLIFSTTNGLTKQVNGGDGGIGLTNLRRRLELLYPGTFELTHRQNGDLFECTLKLNLK